VTTGTISSSGVTKAIHDYWEYYEPIRENGPPHCISNIQKLTDVVDSILIGKNDKALTKKLKSAFQLGNLTSNHDFVSLLSSPLGYWQSRNWDPEQDDSTFFNYCNVITNSSVVYPSTAGLETSVGELLDASGSEHAISSLTIPMLNFIGFINSSFVESCTRRHRTQDQCFSSQNGPFFGTSYIDDDISQDWRSWPYQYCTEWGFLQTGSGVPADQLPLISRLIDLEYSSIICREAFNITTSPNTNAVNKYGGWDAAYERLAFIDGQADPWIEATPHSSHVEGRASTASQPFILIEGAVHHWDENGLFLNETTTSLPPQPVAQVQKSENQFVNEWMQEWQLHRRIRYNLQQPLA
jgi:hypothetical protein